MNIEGFVSFNYCISFAGMIVIVILLTQFTKQMIDKIIENRTKYVVYAYALLLCVLAAGYTGKFDKIQDGIETCVIWLINSVIVWFSAMKAYETAMEGK